eukprot:jgi/Psemu1/303616/fgenesh1_kg.114_\
MCDAFLVASDWIRSLGDFFKEARDVRHRGASGTVFSNLITTQTPNGMSVGVEA